MAELKNYPFCGKGPYTVTMQCGTKKVWHVCAVVAAELSVTSKTEQGAIQLWNTRVPQPAASVDREALAKLIADTMRICAAGDDRTWLEHGEAAADALIAAGMVNRPEALREALVNEVRRLRQHYGNFTATDQARQQMLDHFEKFALASIGGQRNG